jgi:hypothetical protein
VITPGENLRLRENAGFDSRPVGTLGRGDIVTVIDGPICADGYLWWQVLAADGVTAWAAESGGAFYMMLPVNTPTPPGATAPPPTATASPTSPPTLAPTPTVDTTCWAAPMPRLQPGDAAQVANTVSAVRLRILPAVGAGEAGLLRPGAAFTVLDGPLCNTGYHWYRVEVSGSTSGWIAEGEGQTYWLQPAGQTSRPLTERLCLAWADSAGLHVHQAGE